MLVEQVLGARVDVLGLISLYWLFLPFGLVYPDSSSPNVGFSMVLLYSFCWITFWLFPAQPIELSISQDNSFQIGSLYSFSLTPFRGHISPHRQVQCKKKYIGYKRLKMARNKISHIKSTDFFPIADSLEKWKLLDYWDNVIVLGIIKT